MAYKFQLGTAKLSGSIQLTDGSIDSTAVDQTTAENVIDTIRDGDIPLAKLAEKTISGKDLGTNLDALTAGNGISMSSYNGAAAVSDLTIQRSGSAHGLKLDAGGLAVQRSGSQHGLRLDAGGLAVLRSGSAHALKIDANGMAVLLSGSTGLAIDNGGLKLNAVPNASLANDSVTITAGTGLTGGGEVVFGASVTVSVDGTLEDLDALSEVADGQFIVGSGAGTFAYESGATARTSLGLGTADDVTFTSGSFSGDLTVTGDLTILGGVVSASVEQLKIQDAKITVADGVADLATAATAGAGFEVGNDLAKFQVASGSGVGIHFSSSLPFQAGTLAADSAFIDQWQISSTQISGNLPVSASAFYGDGSNLSGVSADNASELDFNIAVVENTAGIVSRFTKVDTTANNAFTVTMPGIDANNDGAMFVIKDYTGNCATEPVTIAPSGSQRIEGAAQNIILESGFAAVTMVGVWNSGTNPGWLII